MNPPYLAPNRISLQLRWAAAAAQAPRGRTRMTKASVHPTQKQRNFQRDSSRTTTRPTLHTYIHSIECVAPRDTSSTL